MRQGQGAIVGPQGIRRDVGDDDRLGPVGGRSTRSGARADGHSVDGLDIGARQAGRGAVAQGGAIGPHQQDRAERATAPLLGETERVQDQSEPIAPGDHLQQQLLPGQEGVRHLAILDVGRHAVPPDDAPALVPQGRDPGQEPAIDAVGPTEAGLDLERLTRRERFAPCAHEGGPIVGMHRDLPSRALGVLEPEAGVFEAPAVDELDGAVGPDDAGPRRNGVDHQPELVLEGLDLPERRAPPRDEAGDHEGGRQEGHQSREIERLDQRGREARRREEAREAEERDQRDDGRGREIAGQRDEHDRDQVQQGGPEGESNRDRGQNRQTDDGQPRGAGGRPESGRRARLRHGYGLLSGRCSSARARSISS